MKIGILGTRSIPNAYGGFEQFAEYLAQGLQQKGHEVYVYNSSDHPYQQKEWRGIHIIHCKDPENSMGTAGQFIYDFNCLMDARRRHFDALLQLGYTSNSVWHWIWPRNPVNVVNMDGLEWKRTKYSRPVQRFLRSAERWAVRHGDVLIADSIGIQSYLLDKYGKASIYIPYGAEIPTGYSQEPLARWNLVPGGYNLVMARIEPENNIEMIIQGWLSSSRRQPLVIIGNPGNAFGAQLRKLYSDDRLLFVGGIYDQPVVNALRHHAFLYFHGHSVGGTNPSLLEAMACECAVAAHDNAFNKAVLQEDALYFSDAAGVSAILDNPPANQQITAFKKRNLEKIRQVFNWPAIIDQYEKVLTAKQ